jgi:hypothetical protein
MAYHPEDVGSKPTAGIYSFIACFTEMRYNASCILFTLRFGLSQD